MGDFFTGREFYVPAYEVVLGKKRLQENVVRDVIQVQYKDDIKEIDSFDITINNWDAEKRVFKYTDQNMFDPGNELQLWMGYYERGKDQLQKMITGEITGLRPTFPPSGQPTLSVNGVNRIHRFRTKQETHTYENKTDSQIAKEIGSRLNMKMKTKPQDEKPYEHLFQENEYDIIFLMNRAYLIGYTLYMEEGDEAILHFEPSTEAREVPFNFVYGKSLVQFQPNLNTSNQVAEVTILGWNNRTKEKIKHTAKRKEIITKGNVRFEKAFKERREIRTNPPVESIDEARRVATQTLENIAKEMITGSGSSVGMPELRAGSVVMIEGLGELFSGRYFVTATTHTINDSGYLTQFECRKEEKK